MSRVTKLFLVFCAIFAFFLRWYLLPSHLFFGPEQGRDFLEIKKIAEGNFTLIGPKTDFSGVFHGPLYYYLAAIPFALSRGNPLVVAHTLTFIQAFTVFLAYAAAKEVSGKRDVGMIAAILFTVSYGAIVYSRWLTQVPLAIPFSFLFLWQLFRFLNGKHHALIWAAVAAGLLGQVQFIYFLFVPVFLVYIILRFRKQFLQAPRRVLFYSIASYILVSFGTYIVFDLRHEFLITKSIFSIFTPGQHTAFSFEPFTMFLRWIGKFIGIPT